VIRRTLQLVRGIGPWREKDLWARGLHDWEAVRTRGAGELPAEQHLRLCRAIDAVEEALGRGDIGALAAQLPARVHWRLWPLVADRALCLDIEADGTGESRPTVVGCLDASGLATFVDGLNLDSLPERLASSQVWVTFNGGSFDLPVLRRSFPDLPGPTLHLDLHVICQSMGLGGGLKEIEDRLAIGRPRHVRGTNGLAAVLLWRAYRERGDLEALRALVEYNLYDAFQLRALADHAFNRGAERLHWPDRVRPWERGEVLYDLSRLLMALSPLTRGVDGASGWGEAWDAPVPRRS
jgi:uncharacterized protein YprB with RNaseH-like and TPR domain